MSGVMVTDTDRPTCRPFTLGDAMILIITVALGLVVARFALVMMADALRSIPYARLQKWDDWWAYLFGKNHFAVSFARLFNLVLLNFLTFLLPAFLIIRIKPPRPPLHSLIRQPGFLACAAPVAVLLVFLPLALINLAGAAGQVVGVAAQVLLVTAAPVAWLWLVVIRRWSPEPGWIDRLGRISGAAWAACLAAHLVLIRLPY
jgi:hypothetical protein